MNTIVSALFLVALFNLSNGFALPQNNIIHPVIANGTDTTIDAHPYQVSVRLLRYHRCDGSILTANIILTAAQCLYPYAEFFVEYFSVRVGATERDEGVEYFVSTGVYPEDFTADTYDFDVGLLKLVVNLEFSANVAPVVLAEQNRALPYGENAIVTGWGRIYENEAWVTTLQKASIEVLDRGQCIEVYQNYRPITDYMFCAGSFQGLVDSCIGYSGGPVVHDGVQIGIVSLSFGCSPTGYPGVYTDVAMVRGWIDKNSANL